MLVGELPAELPPDILPDQRTGPAIEAATKEIARRNRVSQIEALRAVNNTLGGIAANAPSACGHGLQRRNPVAPQVSDAEVAGSSCVACWARKSRENAGLGVSARSRRVYPQPTCWLLVHAPSRSRSSPEPTSGARRRIGFMSRRRSCSRDSPESACVYQPPWNDQRGDALAEDHRHTRSSLSACCGDGCRALQLFVVPSSTCA